ncbi:MAG TPA: glycosyl hydrolase [Bacteroidales bacterium]|nr:glycosyl hydrolase [Bacteroidales bacterium]
MRKNIISLLILITQLLPAQELKWPEIKSETRPWTRMWWMGSIGTKQDITAALEKYSKAGLGGVEVTCIYGVKGEEDRFVDYLSPEWMEKFMHILNEGRRLGLGIDLANASGWPFGGPWVNPEDACRNINYRIYNLKSGEKLNEKIEFIQQPLIRPVGQKPDITTLNEPIGRNQNLQLYALDQIRFEKSLPVKSLIAYSDAGVVRDLTMEVNDSGILNWTAPAGSWTLYALFEGWHGKMAERAGPGGEGDVIDHFSGKAIDNFLRKFDNTFRDYDVSYLRGYFNDSYEVDDASGQADWTDNLFEEFLARRGYDLRDQLPALFQKDIPEKNERVLSDYRQTISDLLLDKFTNHWRDWANRQGKLTRNQSHGSPGNILDLYAASDIPETEGYELTRVKFASSAANITGKKLVSCEAATWLNEHFISTLADVRAAADLFFLGGINHLFYHGTCFSPEDEPWPGFLFYAATEFTPANSFWDDFPTLNDYIARIQSFMQQGKADNDILLYFPISDTYASRGRGMLEHIDALTPAMKKAPFGEAAEALSAKGYGYDYVSDMQLGKTEAAGHILQTEGNEYEAIVVPACKYIPVETFKKLVELGNEGANIIFYVNLPEKVSGFAGYEEKTRLFEDLKKSLNFNQAGEHASVALTGKGQVIMGDNLGECLSLAGLRREEMSDQGIMFMRRKNPSGSTYFIKNTSEKRFEGWLPLSVNAASAAIFDPSSGSYGTAGFRHGKSGSEVRLSLKPSETLIICAYTGIITGNSFNYYAEASAPVSIPGKWKLTFEKGGPGLPGSRELEELVSWTETGGDDVKNFSGTALYSTTFLRPEGKADAWILDLGKVCNSARVILNGREIAVLTGPYFSITIDNSQLRKSNRLEIKVSNLMANRIAWMDREQIVWKKFYNVNFAARLRENTSNGIFDASGWKALESGLIGPVTITALKKL